MTLTVFSLPKSRADREAHEAFRISPREPRRAVTVGIRCRVGDTFRIPVLKVSAPFDCVGDSMTLIQRANCRTIDSFRAQVARCTFGRDCWDHSKASWIVMKRAFLRLRNLTNRQSALADSSSRVPSDRLASTYSFKWCCRDFIADLPSSAKDEPLH